MRDRTWIVTGLGVLMVAIIGLAIGAMIIRPTSARPVPAAAPPPAPSSTPPAPPPPPAGPPVFVVKIDNAAEARPPVGIGAADMIFVEPVEGGLSRVAAVFASQLPPAVGPVRSARQTDIDLLPQFGHPTLAYSGAASALQPQIDGAPLNDASQANAPHAYFRDNSRVAPHNLFVHPDQLPPGDGWSPQAPLVFGPAPEGGTPTDHQDVTYPAARVGFDWSAQDARWQVSMDGAPYVAVDSGRLEAGTVIIQSVPVEQSSITDVAGSPSPVAQSVGGGHATVLRDGQAFDATWSRPSPDVGTTYTTSSGQPIQFAPGQVWTVFVPQ